MDNGTGESPYYIHLWKVQRENFGNKLDENKADDWSVFLKKKLELLDKLHVVLSSHDASKGISFDVQMQLRLIIAKHNRSKIIILYDQ